MAAPVGAQVVADDRFGRAEILQSLLYESESRCPVTLFGNVTLEDLAFVVDGSPEVTELAVHFDVHLV